MCRLFAGSVLAGLAPGALLLTGDLVDGKTAIGRGHQLKPEWEVRRARLPACTAFPSPLHPPHSATGRKRLAAQWNLPAREVRCAPTHAKAATLHTASEECPHTVSASKEAGFSALAVQAGSVQRRRRRGLVEDTCGGMPFVQLVRPGRKTCTGCRLNQPALADGICCKCLVEHSLIALTIFQLRWPPGTGGGGLPCPCSCKSAAYYILVAL